MKKLFKTLFLLSFVGMAITACNNTSKPEEEKLTYATEWSTDAVEHWHVCTSEGHEGEKGDLAEHTFNEGVVTPATYEADGYTTYTCTVCGYSYQGNLVHKLSHHYSEQWFVDNESGTHYHACTDEGYTHLRADEAEHDYDLGVTTPATYEAAGYTTYTCKVCGHKDVHAGDAQLTHNFATEWSHNETKHWHACTDAGYETLKSGEANHDFHVTVIPATHETPEYEIHECTVCHYIETTEGGQAVAHNYATEWSHNTTQHWHACTDAGYESLKKDTANHTFNDVVTPSTFENQGYTTHTCSVCGYSYVDSYTDVLAHNYSTEWSVDNTAGTHYHACIDEGYTNLRADETLHVWDAGEVTTEPTETTTGVKTYTCTVCGQTKTEFLPMTSHHYSSTWSNNSTHHWHACTDANCTAKADEAAHVWDAGVHHNATYGLDAYTVYTCTVCGYSYSESEQNSRLALQDEARLTFALNDNGSGWVVTGGNSNLYADDYDVYIPETHTEGNVTLPVVEIGEEAFANGYLSKIVMGDNLEKISRSAFNTCRWLDTVELGKDVKTIQSNAFANCYRMTEIFNQSSLNIKLGSTTYGGIARNAAAVVTDAENRGVIAQNDYANNQYIYTIGAKTVLAYCSNPGDTKNNYQINVDEIKPYAFMSTSNIHSVQMLEKVTKIGHHAFYNSGLTAVIVPGTVTSVGESAFENSDALEIATLNNDTISNYEFKDCDTLLNVETGNIKSIGMGAFEFSALQLFTIDSGVTSIGASAFASTYITSAAIPASVTSIGEGAFYNCSVLATITVAGENANYSATDNVLYNKAGTTLICYPRGLAPANFVVPMTVTTIEANAFFGASVGGIVLPNTIASIGATAFRGCNNLQGFLMLNGSYSPVTDHVGSKYAVSQGVLYNADYSTLLAYPAQLPTKLYATQLNTRSIADYAFEDAERLEFIFLGDAGAGACYINSIGIGAFRNCAHLNAVSLIANMGGTRFGLNCFEGAPVRTLNYIGTEASNFKLLNGDINNLHACGIDTIICMDVSSWYTTSLNWNDSTEDYDIAQSGNYVFANGITEIQQMSFAATGVRNVVIPKEVTAIGTQAFGNCFNLKTVTFEEGSQLKTIGVQAFGNCTALESIVIPEGVTSIGDQAFGGCKNLKSVTIPASVTSIGEQAFGNCEKLETVTIASGSHLETIGNQAFGNCAKLESIDIPASVVTIGNQAFGGCTELGTVTFHSNNALTSIGTQAFAQTGITSLTLYASEGNTLTIGVQAFAMTSALQSLVINNDGDIVFAEGDLPTDPGKTGSQAFAMSGVQTLNYSGSMAASLTIGTQAFGNCTSLQRVIFCGGDLVIGTQAFGNCSSLQYAMISCNSNTVGDQAFAGCSSLYYVILPENFTLGIAPFYGDFLLSDGAAAELEAIGYPAGLAANPIFWLGNDPATLQANLAASAGGTNAYGAILTADDTNNPFGHLFAIKGIVLYAADEPDQTTKEAYAAQGIYFWHYDATTNMPTLW